MRWRDSKKLNGSKIRGLLFRDRINVGLRTSVTFKLQVVVLVGEINLRRQAEKSARSLRLTHSSRRYLMIRPMLDHLCGLVNFGVRDSSCCLLSKALAG